MAAPAIPTFTEGHIPYAVDGELFETYYKIYGSLEIGTAPIIILHGGPGLTYDYLIPLSDLASAAESRRPVIFYDQLGNGRSTHLRDKPREFWQLRLFINELSNLIKFLHLESGYHLYGHSWGGVLACEYVLSGNRARGLKSLIIADSLPSWGHWFRSQTIKIKALGPEVLDGLKHRYDDIGKYRDALEKFHAVHGCTLKEVPKEVAYSFDRVYGDRRTGEGGDDTVSENMFANFLTKWDITHRLHGIDVPSFIIHGQNDIADETVNEPFFWKIPKSKWVIFENSTHTPMWEERARYIKVVGQWMSALDSV